VADPLRPDEDVVPLPLIGRALDDELGGLPPRHC
jgi:hypothetical protein